MACDEGFYILSHTTIKERLAIISKIIMDLMLRASNFETNKVGTEEYEYDDGKVRFRSKYRSATEINKSIDSFMAMENKLIRRLNNNGSVVLRSARGLR